VFTTFFGRMNESSGSFFKPTKAASIARTDNSYANRTKTPGVPSKTKVKGKSKRTPTYKEVLRRVDVGSGMCRAVLFFGFFMIFTMAIVLGAVLWLERSNFQSTHVVVGPQGPMGICNISHPNQTFYIAGNTLLDANLSVGEMLTVNDSFSLYTNDTCVVLHSELPLCVPGGLFVNDISSGSDGPLRLYGGVMTEDPVYFGNDAMIYDNLTIGGTTFYWNGAALELIGPSSLHGGSTLPLPLYLDTVTLDSSGDCFWIEANDCLRFSGDVFFDPSTLIQGDFKVNGTGYFDNTVYVGPTTTTGLRRTGSVLELFGTSETIRINTSGTVNISASLLDIANDVSIGGTITSLLKLSQNGLRLTCPAGPHVGELKFDPSCGCLKLTSSVGICLNASSGTNGILVNSNNNVTFDGPNTNLVFTGGASVGSDMMINGDLETNGDLDVYGNAFVDGDLDVAGALSFGSLVVAGPSSFLGPITSTNVNNTFNNINVIGLNSNVTVSKVNTIFQGQGATFQTGTTLQVMSNLFISSSSSQLKCTSPIFKPDTLGNPNNFPCVQECPDMQRCSHKMKSLEIVESVKLFTDASYTGPANATFGQYGKYLGFFDVYATNIKLNVTGCVTIEGCVNFDSSTTVSGSLGVSNHANVSGNLEVNGSITKGGGEMHPCCSGLIDVTTVGAPASSHTDKLLLMLGIGGTSATLTTSELMAIPFDTVINSATSKLTTSFDVGTGIFTAPADGMYAVTVYLDIDLTDSLLGAYRGVTLFRTFGYPSIVSLVPVRICYHRTEYGYDPSLFRFSCTYSGYFKTGNMFKPTVYYDYMGSLTLNGIASSSILPTMMEIYMY
jgi:hypothetical protein